jgi:hypothetical protein
VPPVPTPPSTPSTSGRSGLSPTHRRSRVAAGIIGGAALIAFAAVGATGALHNLGTGAIAVCGSSMAQRVARDVLRGYALQNPKLANRFELQTSDCAVRFSSTMNGRAANIIGLDGVVAIVNPQNPVSAMSVDQLRKIVAGNLTNWTALGGRSQPVTVYVPGDSTDEARLLGMRLLNGAAVGTSVVRVPSSADAVRAVVAANGRNAIGLVAFSAAVPGKVVTLKGFPPPSVLSIGDRQYPLSVAITAAPVQATTDAHIGSLLTYAGSDEARAIAQHDGFIEP